MQDINDFRTVLFRVINDQSTPTGREVHELGMWNVNPFAVGHVNAKRPKRCCFVKFSYLFGDHAKENIVPARNSNRFPSIKIGDQRHFISAAAVSNRCSLKEALRW